MSFGTQGVAHPSFGSAGVGRAGVSGAVQADGAIRFLLPETKQYLRKLTTEPSSQWTLALNTFIQQLKSDNNWDQFDRLWIFATEQQQHAQVDVKSTQSLTEVGGITWTAFSGYNTHGPTQYLNSNYNPALASNVIQAQRNSTGAGMYLMTSVAPTGLLMGVAIPGSQILLIPQNGTSARWGVNDATQTGVVNPVSIGGLMTISRSSPSATQVYKHGVQLDTSALASAAPANLQLFIGTQNSNGSPLGGSLNTLAMFFIGSGNINQALLNASIENFLFNMYSFQAETTRWLSMLTVRPTFFYAFAMDTLIKQMKADGNWQLLDQMWIFATEQQQHAQVPIVNPGLQITEVPNGGTLTWAALQGYSNGGAKAYLNTNWNPVANGVNYVLGSASAGLYSRTNFRTSGSWDMGSYDGTTNGSIFCCSQTTAMLSNINDDAALHPSFGALVASSVGMFSFSRTTTGTGGIAGWLRGVSQSNIETPLSAGSVANFPFFILTYNSAGSPANPTIMNGGRQIAMAFVGSGSIDQLKLYNAFQTFMTTLGTNI
jgi:hypothetical protein